MARPDKAAAVAELTDAFRESSAAVLTEYRGLTVAQLSELRRSLAGHARYTVVKNTLSQIAARQAGLDGLAHLLTGPSAVAFVTGDPVAVAKALREFGRGAPQLVVKGGLIDGRAASADDIRRLADLESREVMLAQLAGMMTGALAKAAGLFQAPLAQVARLAEALRAEVERRPGAAPQPPAEPPAAAEPAAAEPAVSAAEDVGEMPTDGTPGVEATPGTSSGDPGADAQAVADATDIAPGADVADGATSAS